MSVFFCVLPVLPRCAAHRLLLTTRSTDKEVLGMMDSLGAVVTKLFSALPTIDPLHSRLQALRESYCGECGARCTDASLRRKWQQCVQKCGTWYCRCVACGRCV